MELHQLVATWSALRKTRSRLEKTALLAELLRDRSNEEVQLAVSYLSGQIPAGKIGIGYAAVRKALEGDFDECQSSLSLIEVEQAFRAIADQRGAGSGNRRATLLRELFESVSHPERELLSRLIVGELRQGASEGLMCEAIAEAAEVPADKVRRALMLCGDLPRVAALAFARGAQGLGEMRVELFVPLRPMLAQPADDVHAAIDLLGEALFETKLDGARVQAHKRRDEVRVYSRALNEVTSSVPEVVEAVRALDAESVILDGEAIALRQDGRPHPFQTTMRRFGRRRDVDAQRETLPLSVYFFDLIYRDGASLVDSTLRERRAQLESIVPPEQRPAAILTRSVEDAETLWSTTIELGHEGLMVKSPESLYEAGSRGSHWLKLKPAHTLDLVVIAAEWGSGRRDGWLSNLHLAAYEPDTDSFAMLGKTFKGLTDELLEWQTRELLARETHREGQVVYVRPQLVAEIAFNDVQASSRYPSGLALRFARMKRYRTDKAPTAADRLEVVREIHRKSAGAG